MRRLLPLLLLSGSLLLWLLPGPVSAACCIGVCDPATYPYVCGTYRCDSQAECNARSGPPPQVSPFCAGNTGIRTALGCVPFAAKAFVSAVLIWAVRLGGVIAFLVLIYAAFILATAGGDPKKAAAGRELVTASIAGLVFLSLSVVLLNFLGVDILGLGSLGFFI